MKKHALRSEDSRIGFGNSSEASQQAIKVVVYPLMEPQREIDITQHLVSAIAEELWRLYGGNGDLNWLEAEAHLQQIVGETRAATAVTDDRRTAPMDRRTDVIVLHARMVDALDRR